jgi:hypothetical protein
MRDTKNCGVFVAAVLAIALPNLAFAESLHEPSDFGEESDGAEISAQLDEDVSDVGGDHAGGDHAGGEVSTDASDESTDVVVDTDMGVVDDDDVAEVVDAWVTTTEDGEEPIYLEFASGSGPVQRDSLPLPSAPGTGPSSPNLVSADRFDATLGINVHDKVAVAAQCAILHESGEMFQAFYKLYCD